MEGADRLVPASAYTGNPDLFISVDVPVVERLNNSARCSAARRMWCVSITIRRARNLPS
ncbi:MAG: hypothetical protein ACLU0O_01210 [Collinsella sp.]